MTLIRVVYSGQLRTVVGRSADEVAFDAPPTLQQLLDRLVELHGDDFQQRVFAAPGKLRVGILLCIGEAHVGDDLARQLSAGDVVTILMAISGG